MSTPRPTPPVLLLFGTPYSGIESQAQRLAQSGGGVHLGDLQLSLVERLGQLREVYALAQTPQHEPLFAALRRHLPAAAADPDAFLAAHAHWSVGELLTALLAAIDAPLVTLSDVSAGFRIHQVERWFARLPQAGFVHVTTPLAAFVAAASAYYDGKLYVPPDYRDHCVVHPTPPLKPQLAWYQVQATLARAYSDARGVRRRRIDIDALAGLDAAQLMASTRETPLDWPYAHAQPTAMAPSLPQLIASLGY